MSEVSEIVEGLNIKLFDMGYDDGTYEFSYISNGYIEIVEFSGIRLWDSESDSRLWLGSVGDYEPLDKFLFKKLKNIGEDIKHVSRYLEEHQCE